MQVLLISGLMRLWAEVLSGPGSQEEVHTRAGRSCLMFAKYAWTDQLHQKLMNTAGARGSVAPSVGFGVKLSWAGTSRPFVVPPWAELLLLCDPPVSSSDRKGALLRGLVMCRRRKPEARCWCFLRSGCLSRLQLEAASALLEQQPSQHHKPRKSCD